MATAQDAVQAIAEMVERILQEHASGVEFLLASYLKAHPELGPDDIILIERQMGNGSIGWSVERKAQQRWPCPECSSGVPDVHDGWCPTIRNLIP